MTSQPVTYEIDPGGKFKSAIQEAAGKVDDLTIPLMLISKSWFQGNKAIFSLKGPGKYEDYKKNKRGISSYANKKARLMGSPYPMLRGETRNLEFSLTEAGDANSINQIINKKSMILGTKVSYGSYLQLGTKFMAARPFMFIGAEQQAPGALETRRDAWVAIVQDYVKQVTQKVGTWR